MCAVLIVICGLPATGKTTLAAAFTRRTRVVHLSVDAAEEALLGAGLEPGWATGVAAYEVVRAAAEQNLALGLTVVVDAVNDSEAARQTWRTAADRSGAELRFRGVAATGARRASAQAAGAGVASRQGPTWQQIVERAQSYEPWADADAPLQLSADHPVATVVERLQQELDLDRFGRAPDP